MLYEFYSQLVGKKIIHLAITVFRTPEFMALQYDSDVVSILFHFEVPGPTTGFEFGWQYNHSGFSKVTNIVSNLRHASISTY